ncbi:MAG: rod shape-determining protein MreC [Lachnospiraceae bacterium]
MNKKKKFKFKSKHIFVLMTLLCISLLIASASGRFPGAPINTAAGYIVLPFQNTINVIGNWFSDIKNGFDDTQVLAQENKTLQAQITELEEENTNLRNGQTQLERLQELYKIDKTLSNYDKIGAEVIAKDSGNWYNSFVINKGSNDGIEVDMNVISGDGLLGIITQVGASWARVTSIIDDGRNVSGMASSTGATCVVSGDLTLMEDGKIQFSQLANSDDLIQVGESIVTSHISNKYVPGILIGYISEMQADSNQITYSGYLIPAADFQQIHEVLVITNLKETVDTTTEG